jgi:acyl transferase domain-containing protein/thioesterase domain-containing protein
MIPTVFVRLEEFPRTPNAKLDRKALPAPGRKRPHLAQDYIAPRTASEKRLADLWCELLMLDEIGIDDNFFDLGGDSLTAVRMARLYGERFEQEIPAVKVFQYSTIAQLCRYLEEGASAPSPTYSIEPNLPAQGHNFPAPDSPPDGVAVIGMVGRFPGADNLDKLWENLRNSVESISFFKPEELGPGIEEYLKNDPDYVRARGIINGADLFDAPFFGISPLEAQVMDPQQRVFLELAHHALENAGYDPTRCRGRIGVYAGIGDNHYYTTNLLSHPDLLAAAGKLAVEYGNEKDYIALRVAYLLDLRGPAVSLNTACSTSLATIDNAYNTLLNFECDIALAGGIDISVPQKSGFLYQEGGTFARDGHCRPFDADATGTMFCDGAGIVVLKRLADALADGDSIYAVVRGSAKNNNGARPVSFLAPSVEGQSEVIAMAQSRANVPVESIGYIEAHGTATPLGDPIEFDALCRVFAAKTNRKQFCYLGSIKGNIGHPTNAAGVAGFIKAAMSLDREEIPPLLHFKKPNPKIDFAQSPFMVADRLIPFPRGEKPRRAAVSSFGFGGTNVHMILEEAPERRPLSKHRPLQLLPISARTSSTLDAYTESLARHLEKAPESRFADVAFTLQVGRKQFAQRRFAVATDSREAVDLLRQPHPLRCGSKRCERRDPPVVFLFGGQGTQYVNMGHNLYQGEPLFRAIVDDCCEQLAPHLGRDLRELLYPVAGDEEAARQSLRDTFFTQPSIFVIEYALARLWQSWGVQPAMMVGHSIGEFVAATLAGVWDLSEVLRIVAKRGRLMQNQPRGSMLAVSSSAANVEKMLPPSLHIASINAPSLCVVSGPDAEVAAFVELLKGQEIVCRNLHTSHAFHSSMMDPIVAPLRDEVAKVHLRPPTHSFISTVTGQPITPAEATDPGYWARHARVPVQFSRAIWWLVEHDYDLFLECGPRSTSCTLARQHFTADRSCAAFPSFTDTHENNAEWATLLFALGGLWQNGVSLDWDAFYAYEERRRIPIPTYPFERQRYWIDPAVSPALTPSVSTASAAYLNPPVAEVAPPDRVEPRTIPAMVAPQPGQGETRKTRLVAELIEILVPISGRDRSQISPSATLLEQGFDSLSLTQVAFAIRKEFGVRVSFSQLMKDFPSIEILAAHLDKSISPNLFADQASTEPGAGAPASVVPPPDLEAPAEKATVPTPGLVAVESTVPQRGIYISSRLSEHLSASYNESMTLLLTGRISIRKLTRSLERLVARHDALRAAFDDTGTIMRIAPAQNLDVPVIDLAAISNPADRESRLAKILAEETTRPFSLPGGPLFRSQIVLLNADSAAIVFTGHHIICDGWSLDVLIHDLCAFYSEEISGKPANLRPVGSYTEYVRAYTQRANSEEFREARQYWLNKFADGYPALVLPTKHARPGRRGFAARRLDHTLPVPVVQGMRVLAAKERCSFFTLLLGGLSLLLARLSRQRRFVITLPAAEQPVVGQPDLVGHCVSLLPFVVNLVEGEELSAFLSRVQGDLAAAHDHSAFTLVNLLEELRANSSVHGVSPLAAGLTNVKKFQPHELPQWGFSARYSANPLSFQSFELYLNAVEAGDSLEFECHYDTGLFDAHTVQAWLKTLEATLRKMAEDPPGARLELSGLKGEAEDSSGGVLHKLPPSAALGSSLPVAKALPPRTSAPPPLLASPSPSAPPADLLAALLDLWRRALNVGAVGPDADFFELGGHSIVAAQLFMLIERELGLRAPLAGLYESPTPRTLARTLAQGKGQETWKSLVAIKRTGNRPPLFLIHAAEGNVLLYRNLASHLGPDQPVYGLQAAGLDGHSPIDSKFEHVASRYIEEIRKVQPAGPYLLGGYCLGGTIALEVARQLREAGESIGLLAMIENFNIKSVRWPLPLPLRAVNRILNPFYHLQNLLAAEGASKWNFFGEKARTEFRRAKISAHVALARAQHWFGMPSEYHHLKVADAFDKALTQYQINPYPGKLTIFMAKRRLAGMGDPLGGWGQVAEGGMQLIILPISARGSLVEPHVQVLAARLRECIDEASSAQADSSHPEERSGLLSNNVRAVTA